jgi:hypothetical protein
MHVKRRRFVFKKAHLSRDDFRIFDGGSDRPVAVLHHFGKNPYEKIGPSVTWQLQRCSPIHGELLHSMS